ncbi:hypothetical protein [Yoonia algicola]|uniref:2TM domain-containing protein n=1 Tax=Yoonia algicola TaxID=3137368 RepID=A0AAN0M2N5_9RHOB
MQKESKPQIKFGLPTSDPTRKDELIESLQNQLDDERDRRKEERFIWLVIVILMFDAFTFSNMQTWTGPIIIGLIQLIIVIVLGRRWQMDEIWTLTTKLIDKWDGKFGKG